MLLDHDKGQLFLVAASDPVCGSYVLDTHRVFSKEGIQYSFCLGQGAAGQAVVQKKPVLVEDVDKSCHFALDGKTQIKLGSVLAIPMIIEDQPLGVLNLSHPDKYVFEANDINLFNILANFIALSVHNSLNHEKLKYSEQKYRALAENSNDGIAIIQDGLHVYANPAYQKITGYQFADGDRIPFTTLLDGSDPANEADTIQNLLQGKGANQQLKLCVLDSKQRRVELEINSSVITYNGKDATIISARDLTPRRELERQLHHAQKMEAIGTLAGGIAHDFKNILQSIMGFSELLLLEKEEADPDCHKLRRILQSVERADQLTYQLLAFSRKIESVFQQVELNQVVERMVGLLRSTLPKMIDIDLQLGSHLEKVSADPAQIEQVLMNLCINARDAMPDGGRLAVTTANVVLGEQQCRVHPAAEPGMYVRLTVSDTGSGMDAGTLERIFEPFFTTKDVGKGTGLGLAIVYGIVQNHGGFISCASVPGQGTRFDLHFPAVVCAATAAEQHSAEPRETPIEGGRETILLVDDESLILDGSREIFERYGYRVVTARQGEQAVKILEKGIPAVDLVILDLNMPGMTGEKCFARIRAINPRMKIIIGSGYPLAGPIKRMLESSADGFISKPYQMKHMLAKVREILDSSN
jgi:PAS domain S-box-containing protein